MCHPCTKVFFLRFGRQYFEITTYVRCRTRAVVDVYERQLKLVVKNARVRDTRMCARSVMKHVEYFVFESTSLRREFPRRGAAAEYAELHNIGVANVYEPCRSVTTSLFMGIFFFNLFTGSSR